MEDDPLLDIKEVESLYLEIAKTMRKRGVTKIRRSLIDPAWKPKERYVPIPPPKKTTPVMRKRGPCGRRRR